MNKLTQQDKTQWLYQFQKYKAFFLKPNRDRIVYLSQGSAFVISFVNLMYVSYWNKVFIIRYLWLLNMHKKN